MRFIVSYDISDDKRRNRIARTLQDFGVRGQYSVFECILNENDFECLRRRAQGILDLTEDSLRIYPVCGHCEKAIEIIGTGHKIKDPDWYIL